MFAENCQIANKTKIKTLKISTITVYSQFKTNFMLLHVVILVQSGQFTTKFIVILVRTTETTTLVKML